MTVTAYYFILAIAVLFFYNRIQKYFSSKVDLILASFVFLFAPYFFVTHGIRDIELYESVGYFFRHKVDIYYQDADHQLWPYFPFLNFILGVLYSVSQNFMINFLNLWRLITLSSLLLCAFLITKIQSEVKPRQSIEKVLLFIFSPLSIWPVVYHAHPDILVSTFYIIAIYLIYYQKDMWVWGYVSLGFSVLAKTWSFVFIPLLLIVNRSLLQTVKRLSITAFSIVLIPAIYYIFWHSSIVGIVEAVVGYGGSWTVNWGPLGIFTSLADYTFSENARSYYTIGLFLLAYLIIFLKKIKNILAASEFVMLTFFLFTISWAPQYIFWVWPFVVLKEKLQNIRLFSLLSFPYVFLAYGNLSFDLQVDNLIPWFSIPIWVYALNIWYSFRNYSSQKVNILEKQ